MKTYLIQYNESDRSIFENRVKAIGEWVKYFSDNWIVTSELTSKQIYDKLTDGYEKSILIVEISNSNYYGRMNTKVWDFLKESRKK